MKDLSTRAISVILSIRGIFLRHELLKFVTIPKFAKVDLFPQPGKNYGLLRKVPVIRVVQGILDVIADQHLYATWRLFIAL